MVALKGFASILIWGFTLNCYLIDALVHSMKPRTALQFTRIPCQRLSLTNFMTGTSIMPSGVTHGRMDMAVASSNIAAGAEAADSDEPPPSVESSVTKTAVNLAKSLIGASALSFPSSLALITSERAAILPASLFCIFFGCLAAYSFAVIGKVCHKQDAATFREAWSSTVGKSSAWIVTGIIAAPCFFTLLAYSIVIGDSFSSLAKTLSLPAAACSSNNATLFLTALILLPLCSLRSLSALTPFSLVGLAGTLFTALVMLLRLVQGAYAPGGKFFTSVALKPSLHTTGGYNLLTGKTFVFLSVVSSGFLGHFGAPAFYNELKNASVARFNIVVRRSFSATTALYLIMMAAGFLTFGGASQSFILNNYSNKDNLIAIARLMIGLSMITTYPFSFAAMRESIMDLLHLGESARQRAHFPITTIGLSLLTILSFLVNDVGFIASLSGALFGYSLMFVVPMLMNIAKIRQRSDNGRGLPRIRRLQLMADYTIICLGIFMSIAGVSTSVLLEMGRL